ncbi:MAG: phosphotransferase [Alphaproteobacteria bacterium]|nr:phosphotransferase [Alphaproteobacteria bacterium]
MHGAPQPNLPPLAIEDLLAGLATGLTGLGDFGNISIADLHMIPTTGLAHDHVRLADRKLLARVPKQSQMDLDPQSNLVYQTACFARAAPSGHTPHLHAVLPVGEELPMGALIVDEIEGSALPLPDHIDALAKALAAIHTLPVPPDDDRRPLKNPVNALADTFSEILEQSAFIGAAGLDYDAEAQIREELVAAGGLLSQPNTPATALIAFDAHPGNFLLGGDGRAVLVDLEKARYGIPAFDLAHATLYTSTTWDVATYAELGPDQVADFYATWLAAVPKPLADSVMPWLLDLRRMMWLWSVTWCAKWRVRSQAAAKASKHEGGSAEDWSADLSDPALVAHVADRVEHYLDPATIERVRQDWRSDNALTALLGYNTK